MHVRPPHVAGAAGGVGTSIVAAALLAVDCGAFRPGMPVDVLVCRGTLDSLGAAQRVLAALPGRPLLAVNTDVSRLPPGFSLRGPSGARLRMLEGHTRGVVLLPLVSAWREVDNPWQHAAAILHQAPTRATRDFRTTVEDMVSSLVNATGQTSPGPIGHAPSPPMHQRPIQQFSTAFATTRGAS